MTPAVCGRRPGCPAGPTADGRRPHTIRPTPPSPGCRGHSAHPSQCHGVATDGPVRTHASACARLRQHEPGRAGPTLSPAAKARHGSQAAENPAQTAPCPLTPGPESPPAHGATNSAPVPRPLQQPPPPIPPAADSARHSRRRSSDSCSAGAGPGAPEIISKSAAAVSAAWPRSASAGSAGGGA
jgi:hypothetical protein